MKETIYNVETGETTEREITGKELEKYNKEMNAYLIREQIETLKQMLSSTDYQAIKYAEGELPYADYEPMRKQRREWRAEINRLEQQLNG